MNKKIAILLTVLMVAALAAPAVMADNVPYSATVTTGQSTTVTASDGAFGSVAPGTLNTKTNSITCQNVGNVAATVAAKFTTSSGATFGMVVGTNVIGGSNFQLGDVAFNALNDSGIDVTLTNGVPANSIVTYDAKLQVPAGQAAGAYAGTVQLTFS